MAAYNAGSEGPPPTEQTTQNTTGNLQMVNLKLKRLLDARKNNLPLVSQTILDIHKITERKVENQVTQKNEFYGNGGKLIKQGMSYHIHYTNDLNEYYMTGAKHEVTSKLISRIDLTKSDFSYYNNLNKQSPLIIKSTTTVPTEEDYINGFVTRYFAKKANETRSPSFEVSEEDFESSPLYNFVSLKWYITGNKSLVLRANRREAYIASFKIVNIDKILPNFQYFRADARLSPKDAVLERLGKVTQQSEQSSTQQTQTTPPPSPTTAGGAGMASGAGAASGPPAGSGAGAASGGGGY